VSRTKAEALAALDECAKLKPNWDSYNAKAIKPEAIAEARQVVECLAEAGAPMPGVLHNTRGDVELEWAHSNGYDERWYLSMDCTGDGKAEEYARALAPALVELASM